MVTDLPRDGFRLDGRRIEPSINEIDGNRVDAITMDVVVALADASPYVLSGLGWPRGHDGGGGTQHHGVVALRW
jgi:hypothetical protein